MNRKMIFATIALSASLAATPAVFAQAQTAAPAPAAAKATKPVKFTLRNETKAPMKLRAGDNKMTIAPGESAKVKLPAGQQIVADETSSTFNEGAVVTTVGTSMDGTTLAIR